MTREEIMAMEAGEKLDTCIAEYVFKMPFYNKCIRSFKPWCGAVKCSDECEEIKKVNNLPSYSTDISAVWEVREWIHDNIGGTMLLKVCDELPEYCGVHCNEGKRIEVQAKTMSEALCNAALLCKLEERKS